MSRPTIGITTEVGEISYGTWKDVPSATLPLSYVRALQRAGGRPILLPPDPEDTENPKAVLDLIDALVLSGGSDLEPAIYGQEPHQETGFARPARDAYEIALVCAAVGCGMPILGTCRGMQVLNVAYGGGIEQHLPDVLGHDDHRHTPGTFADHEVRLEPGSLAARAAGAERAPVKSHHHQGVGAIGDSLLVTGWAAEDGTVEALEDPSRPFVLGVLWHPEEDEKSRLISALVKEVI
ncbi:MAG: gamma-glutamyl-gamma-aminobutyrate hydrolase family protein [Acidobacteria bacterium]|jgi:putative glutamine amidotransferase|nr:gamma-glutamyl-gamma-aminobutyrate hydrolase family protein [Acidobacteriota bacterium]